MATPDVQFEFDILKRSAADALATSAKKLLHSIRPGVNKPPHVALRGQIWPQLSIEAPWSADARIELKLLTLERLGIEPGKSGSRVLVGYFKWPPEAVRSDVSTPRVRRRTSRPMVVKVSPRKEGAGRDGEYDSGTRFGAAIYDGREQFALPLFQTNTEEFEVLWAPYATSMDAAIIGDDDGKGDLTLSQVPDLYQLLTGRTDGVDVTPEAMLNQAFDLMHQAHIRSRQSDERVCDAFKWYLRGFDEKDAWSEPWKQRWGTGPETEDSGQTNPFFLIEKLREADIPTRLSFVHGDLHPKNIVIVGRRKTKGGALSEGSTGPSAGSTDTRNWTPHIIDYGWARESGPLAADFVLMECNLRFMLLPASTPYADVQALADWIFPDDGEPGGSLAETVRRIQVVRRAASRVLFNDTGRVTERQWAHEYGVPLFLVAFGLLKFADSAFNAGSAVQTVLSLAERLRPHLIS